MYAECSTQQSKESSWKEKYTLPVNFSFNISLTKLKLGLRIGLEKTYRTVLKNQKSNKSSCKYHPAKGTNLHAARQSVCAERSTQQSAESSWNENYTLSVNISVNISLTKLKLGLQIGLEKTYRTVLTVLKSNKSSCNYHPAKGTNLHAARQPVCAEGSTQ